MINNNFNSNTSNSVAANPTQGAFRSSAFPAQMSQYRGGTQFPPQLQAILQELLPILQQLLSRFAQAGTGGNTTGTNSTNTGNTSGNTTAGGGTTTTGGTTGAGTTTGAGGTTGMGGMTGMGRYCPPGGHDNNTGGGNRTNPAGVRSAQAFNTPEGAQEAGPAMPGQAYEFEVTARPGERLSFASMLVQTNDRFISAGQEGIALFDENGNPRQGDISAELGVYDAGTEIDQPFGQGADQAPRQSGPNTGAADPDNRVRKVDGLQAQDFANVTLEPLGNNRFRVRVENRSGQNNAPATPLSPGVAVTHTGNAPLFTAGQPDRGLGLEAIAEDGDPMALLAALQRLISNGGNYGGAY